MTRIDNHIIRERNDLLLKTVIKQSCQFLLGHVSGFLCKVRTSNIPKEQSVTTEDRVILTILTVPSVIP